MPQPTLATFSIAAVDPVSGEFALASCSNYLALGPLVLHCAPTAGVLLSQSRAHPEAAARALHYLQQYPADLDGCLAEYLADDAQREHRQVAILNADGDAKVFSGQDCEAVVEQHHSAGLVALGNMLIPGTIAAVVDTFRQQRQQQQPLVESCVAALQAGARYGGDKRGKLAAAVQSWQPQQAAYQQLNLRVDASSEPLTQLSQLVALHRLYHPLGTLTFISPEHFTAAMRRLLTELAVPDSAEARKHWLQQHNLAHHLDAASNSLSAALLDSLPLLQQLVRRTER